MISTINIGRSFDIFLVLNGDRRKLIGFAQSILSGDFYIISYTMPSEIDTFDEPTLMQYQRQKEWIGWDSLYIFQKIQEIIDVDINEELLKLLMKNIDIITSGNGFRSALTISENNFEKSIRPCLNIYYNEECCEQQNDIHMI